MKPDGELRLHGAAPDDAETLLAIQRAASLAAVAHVFPPERYPYPDDEVRERWQGFPGSISLAMRDRHAVGLVAIGDCSLHGLYVVPEEWGSGTAEVLYEEALTQLRADGCEKAQLWVLEANARARRFYERRGWSLDGRQRVVSFPPNPIDVGYSLALK